MRGVAWKTPTSTACTERLSAAGHQPPGINRWWMAGLEPRNQRAGRDVELERQTGRLTARPARSCIHAGAAIMAHALRDGQSDARCSCGRPSWGAARCWASRGARASRGCARSPGTGLRRRWIQQSSVRAAAAIQQLACQARAAGDGGSARRSGRAVSGELQGLCSALHRPMSLALPVEVRTTSRGGLVTHMGVASPGCAVISDSSI